MFKLTFILLIEFCLLNLLLGYPDPGRWDFFQNEQQIVIPKSLFRSSKIYVQIICESTAQNASIKIEWILKEDICLDGVDIGSADPNNAEIQRHNHYIAQPAVIRPCSNGNNIILDELFVDSQERSKLPTNDKKNSNASVANKQIIPLKTNPVFEITKDGLYRFCLQLGSEDGKNINASVHIQMLSLHGYLSAADWPLLPFYGIMCLVYVVLGIIWLLVSFLQWRDLLRIQFWIGGVILLGMLEKAMFYAEYQNLNSTGVSRISLVMAAEIVSCAKRTLARMLVIIVSLGFGIVKPRLGSMLHRVVGTGVLFFVLASVESYLRVLQSKDDPNKQILVASIPLAVLDSAICWWIFTSLVQTTRTLRLRRNMVKLSLYRHFTNTLIFSVIASVVFMLYSLKAHRFAECLTDWKELWVDEAFWHVLFSLLLLVIMILWRPTNNNQRYAFTPLLDNPEDEDDDDEEEQFVSDVYGVKMRGNRSSSPRPSKSNTTEEDDLRWVEENIPSAIADAALPILDSDEEIISTKFEVSKMQ